MNSVTVKNKEELKQALTSEASEIVIEDEDLIKQLRVIKGIRKAGPIAIGAAVASIALIPVTGGGSALVSTAYLAGAGTSGAVYGLGIAGLCIAIGGTLLIGIFTDWEEVEIPGVFKLKRKGK